MRKLLKRWYVWLGLVLVLGFAGSVALICSSQIQITQANLDRIRAGMSQNEVEIILGDTSPDPVDEERARWEESWFYDNKATVRIWRKGLSHIKVVFKDGSVQEAAGNFATVWETLQWYAKKGAAKIGVKWD